MNKIIVFGLYIEDNLADFHKLHGGVFFVDSLPTTHTGKINRREVQQKAIELYKMKSNSK